MKNTVTPLTSYIVISKNAVTDPSTLKLFMHLGSALC